MVRGTCTLAALAACAALAGSSLGDAADKSPPVQSPPRFRQLAEGVETAVDPQTRINESFSRHDIVELLGIDPGFDWARNVVFRHDVKSLQFHFKPLRFIKVDVPRPDGTLEPTLVWYLVYRVTNENDEPVRFIPEFELVTHDLQRVYPDRILPVAVPAIQRREDPNRPLANTAEIAGEIGADSESVWGVVTWTGIDPKSDFFSIYIGGLTNAYRWLDEPGGERKYFYKTLKINFWRPGDEHDEHEGEIRLGGPDELDYTWVYR